MQKIFPILGLFAILFVGMISPAMAEDYKWDEKYREIEDEFNEKRHQIDNHFQEEFEELDKHYEELKMEIYEKIDSSDLSDSEIDEMFDELFSEFDEKRQSLESDMIRQFQELEEMFENELRHLDEQAREDYVNADGTYRDSTDYDSDYEDDKYRDYQPHEDDPEWKSIEPLADRIMEIIPMEKIQRLWEAGQIEELVELIVSETDLSHEEAKHVVSFFEKYDDRDYHSDDYPEEYREYDYKEYDYPEPYPVPGIDNGEILRLEQRIVELEDENHMLRETIAELEEKITQINAVVMEQVKFIYEWVLSQ